MMNRVTISGSKKYSTVLWIDSSILLLTPCLGQDDGPSNTLWFRTFIFIFSLTSSRYLYKPLPIISWQLSKYVFCSICAAFINSLRPLDLGSLTPQAVAFHYVHLRYLTNRLFVFVNKIEKFCIYWFFWFVATAVLTINL